MVAVLLLGPAGLSAAAASAATPRTSTTKPLAATTTSPAVTLTLASVSPRSPDAGKPAQPVSFTATVVNNTDTTYSDVRISLQRGLPITQQHLLDDAIATPPETDYQVPGPLDLKQQLLPRQSLRVTYRTTANDLCLCFNGVYPYALVAEAISDPATGFVEVGRTQVFLPSFLDRPKPVSVSWVWPLLDRPHRSIDEGVFTDEQLAGEVGPGGRLDRALRVAELVAGKIRLTLLVDPDLLDSLAVMASPTGYRVRVGADTVPGTGGRLAAAWLTRLKALKSQHDVVLTAYADPDVNAVTRAGLKWSTALDPQVQARISPTLSGDFSSDLLTWPVGGALTSKALDALVGGGASAVMLSDASLPGQNKTEPKPDALSPLPSAAGKAVALVTDSPVEATARRLFTLGSAASSPAVPSVPGEPVSPTPATSPPSQATDQQTLLAQLAVRAEQGPTAGHFVVIVPDRYVNPDPGVAAATIESVQGTTWSRPMALRTALDTVTPVDRGALQTGAENPTAELSATGMAKLAQVEQQVASMNEALHDNDSAAQLLAGFNNGIQRAESSAWRLDPAGGALLIRNLQARINQLTSAVHLVQPAVGTYSLSSSDSPVVVTVSNQLSRAVTVQVAVAPARGVLGFRAPAPQLQTIPAGSIATIRIPIHVDRLGRFQVIATLRTPDGRQLGSGIALNLRATSIGTVTKAITVVSISVLVLALLRRFVRRIRHSQAGPAEAPA